MKRKVTWTNWRATFSKKRGYNIQAKSREEYIGLIKHVQSLFMVHSSRHSSRDNIQQSIAKSAFAFRCIKKEEHVKHGQRESSRNPPEKARQAFIAFQKKNKHTSS